MARTKKDVYGLDTLGMDASVFLNRNDHNAPSVAVLIRRILAFTANRTYSAKIIRLHGPMVKVTKIKKT